MIEPTTSVLVSGASGFVGRGLLECLSLSGIRVRALARKIPNWGTRGVGIEWRQCEEIGAHTDWTESLTGCEAIVHLAARVHILHETVENPLEKFRAINVAGTLNLARQAAQAGVRRFIFMSSAKVNGESGTFSESDMPLPEDPYAISKWEAEQGLNKEIVARTGMDIVILRPPLVYGPGVGANFLRLMYAVDRGIPMPFSLVENCRSLIYQGNLVDAIMTCLMHTKPVGKTYLVSDGDDVSTPELIRRIAKALDCSPRLFPVPLRLMRFAGGMLGKDRVIDRLLGSLAVDSGAIRQELGWTPPYSMQDGLAVTAKWYRQLRS